MKFATISFIQSIALSLEAFNSSYKSPTLAFEHRYTCDNFHKNPNGKIMFVVFGTKVLENSNVMNHLVHTKFHPTVILKALFSLKVFSI